MTNLATETFTGSNGAAWPAQWVAGLTPTGASAAIQSNRGRLTVGTASGNFNGANRVSRRISTSAADVVVLVSFIFDSVPGTNRTACYPRIYVRSQNTSIDGQGGYYIEMSGVDNTWSVGQAISYSGGSMTNSIAGNSTSISKTWVAGSKYWARFGVVGTSIKARVWDDGTAEPSTWGWDSTDTGITGSNPYGFTIGHGVGQCYVDWDDFSADSSFPVAGSSALSVATALSAAGSSAEFASAALSVGTALNVAGAPVRSGATSLSVATALSASGVAPALGATALGAVTALSADGLVVENAGVTFSLLTALSASGLSGKTGTAGLSTGTSLVSSASVFRLAGAMLSATAVLQAVGASYTPPEPVRGTYKVYVRNAALSILGQVDDFLSLDATRVYNDVGSWSMTLSSESPSADLMDPALNPGGGVLVIRDGVTFLTGPIDAFSDNWDDQDGENDVITVSGTDDNLWLFGCLVYPNPAQTPETMSTSFYRSASQPAETTMAELVNKNLGPISLAPRRLATLLTVATGGRGKVQKSPKYRFDVLGVALQQLSVLSQVGSDPTTQLAFELIQEGNRLVFRIDNGAGQASLVKFSKRLGTLRAYEVTRQGPTATELVLGAGARDTPDDTSGVRIAKGLFSYERTDAVFPRRMEKFLDVGVVDPSNADTPTEIADLQEQLDQQANDDFNTSAGQVGATLTPRETSQLSYGADYGLGDFCTAILPRLTFVERIREVELTYDVAQGETIKISVGTSDGAYNRRTKGAYKRISNLQHYINRLKTGK